MSPSARRLLLRCATLMACAATATGCIALVGLGGGDEGTVAHVGQCHDTPDSVLPDPHDPTPAVDCARPHTLETYAVLHPEQPLGPRSVSRLSEQCAQRIGAYLGGRDYRQTAVSVYYFTPSEAQQQNGARWVRCDAGVVTDTAGIRARRVTGSLHRAFAGGVPLPYRRCLNAPPDPTSVQGLVPCERPHVAELLPTGQDLGRAGEPYPGAHRLTSRADAACARSVRSAVPEAFRSLVIVPTRPMWKAGQTRAQCWALAAPGRRLNGSEAQPV